MKRALISGITGQDGAYLSAFLLQKDYEVHGIVRRSASADVINSRLKWLGIADPAVVAAAGVFNPTHGGDIS